MVPETARWLEELLLEWEDARESGRAVSPEELCAGAPELLDEVRRRVTLLEGFASLQEPAVALPPAVPRNFGDYTIKRELGSGVSGVVYLAKDRALRRKVALKVLSPRLGFLTPQERRRLARRFEREAQTLARLRHEAIVPVLHARLQNDEPYFVMEYLPGGSLRDRLPWDPADAAGAAAFLARVADAVRYAHGLGVVHRDLKPANILLDEHGRPCVSDFGLAKLLDEAFPPRDDSSLLFVEHPDLADDAGLTQPGRQPGTPAYMAPEQFDPFRGPVGVAADVWALGAILYEVTGGQRPFPGETRSELHRQVCEDSPAPPRALNPRIPASLERLTLRCLDKDPARRPTAAQLTEALARYRRSGPVGRFGAAALEWWRPVWGLFARRGQTPE
jgi:serine/threonine-protein kinase